jgi:hypothetical protein
LETHSKPKAENNNNKGTAMRNSDFNENGFSRIRDYSEPKGQNATPLMWYTGMAFCILLMIFAVA